MHIFWGYSNHTFFRSQARLQRLGNELGSDARALVNEDDINISILSDEEPMENLILSPKIHKNSPRTNETFGNQLTVSRKDQYKTSPSKKRIRGHMEGADERSKQGIFLSFAEATMICS